MAELGEILSPLARHRCRISEHLAEFSLLSPGVEENCRVYLPVLDEGGSLLQVKRALEALEWYLKPILPLWRGGDGGDW